MTVLALCLHWDWFCGFDLRKDEKSFEMLHLHIDVYDSLIALGWSCVIAGMLKKSRD